MNQVLADAMGVAPAFPGAVAAAHDRVAILPNAFWDVLIGLLALSVLILVVLLIFLRFRGILLRQALKERDKAMEAMRQSKTKYQGLFDMAPVGIFRSTLDGSRYLAANQTAACMYGFESIQEFIRTVRPLDIYADPGIRRNFLDRLLAQGFVYNMELQLVRSDGSIRDVLMAAKFYADEQFIEGCVIDVTEYRVTQKNLADKGRFLQALLDAMANPLFYKTSDGKYRLVNESFLRMLDTTAEAILGKTVFDISSPEQARRYNEMDEALFLAKGQATQRYESVVLGASGSRDVVFSKQTVLDEHGRVEGVLGVITDISQQKRQARQLEEQRALLSTLFESASELIFYKDTHGVYLGCNEKYAATIGKRPEDLIGKTDFDLYPLGLAEQFASNDKLVLETLSPVRHEIEVPFTRERTQVEVVTAPLVGAGGEISGVMGVARDITERKKLEYALKSAEERYRTIFENAVEGIFTTTPHGRYLNANAAMARLFGYDSAEALMREVNDIGRELYERPEDRTDLIARIRAEQSVAGFQARCLRRDGSTFWIELHVRGVFGGDGELHFIEGIAKDVSARKASELELHRQAATDSLTGLPNRGQLRQTCIHMLAQAKRSREKIGVLFIDLDGFKEINDTHGHKVGDELLVQVSDRLRWRLRQSDLAARLGGDEFAVLLWNVQSAEIITSIGQTFVETLSGDYQCSGKGCTLSVSIGASLYPEHGLTVDDLLEKADKAMYAVKTKGKNGFQLADSPSGPVFPVDEALPEEEEQ